MRGRVDVPKAFGISFGRIWTCRFPETWRLSIDSPSKSENGVCINVAGEPEYGMTVDARVLEVDACCTVCADNNLELNINTTQ